jgi:RNA polymerase sigma factor (sigma-70 family)
LARYTASNDGPAFAALVARHGPMVAATCRAILPHGHDVEDAFQATFLVLARKAGSVRNGDALGGWLHRVACRVAIQAKIEVNRRRRRESDCSAMEIPAATRPALDVDLCSTVHEEIDRLPERHRLPIVLCDLEGLSYEKAARQLDWTVPAFRCRLMKARERLRDRLTRRGVTATALAAVIASTTDASSAVAATWAHAAVAAATGGTSSATVYALSQIVLRSMLMAKLKLAASAALAAAGIVSAGVFLGRAEKDDRAPEIREAAKSGLSAEIKDQPKQETTSTALIEVRGRVVDPDGRPVAGATVQTAYLDRDIMPAPDVASGPDGRFFIQVPPWRRNSVLRRRDAMFPWVVASAPGFGPGWASAVREPGASGEIATRLVEAGPPIEGRIVDLEGRPVAGARVKAERVWFARDGKFPDWLAKAADGGVQGPWQGLDQLPTAITATTGTDGRFHIAGIGRDRIAELIASGPTIATARLYALNREGEAISTSTLDAKITRERTIYYGRRFEYAATPTKPIAGIIRDKDTGRAIVGLKLRGMVFDEHSHVSAPGIEATTDTNGHYRLTGLPKAPAYRLFLEPSNGLPYTKTTFRVPAESPALEPVRFDVTLKRGIVVRGRVTDKATGRPVSGYVNAYAFADNRLINEFPGYRSSYESHASITDDGRYEIVALPGRGLIACRSDLGLYRGYVGAETIKGYDAKDECFDTAPQICNVHDYHVLAEVNLDPKAELATMNLQVDPGRTLTATAVDPQGKPVIGTMATGLTDLFSTIEYAQESPEIVIHALDPSKPRRVTVSHAARQLVGSVYLKGNETGSLILRLQPWGTVTGRVVDDEGQPRGGLAINNLGGIYPEPPADQGILPNSTTSPGIWIGRDGRFRIEGLIPGLKYGASAHEGFMYRGTLFKDLTVAPGEVKNLCDLRIVAENRDGQE